MFKEVTKTVKLSSLPFVKLANWEALPNCSAIYLVFLPGNELLYVGKTHHLRHRWKTHHRYKQLSGMGNVAIAWLEVDDPNSLARLEKRFIQGMKPRFHATPVKSKKAKKTNYSSDFYASSEVLNPLGKVA